MFPPVYRRSRRLRRPLEHGAGNSPWVVGDGSNTEYSFITGIFKKKTVDRETAQKLLSNRWACFFAPRLEAAWYCSHCNIPIRKSSWETVTVCSQLGALSAWGEGRGNIAPAAEFCALQSFPIHYFTSGLPQALETTCAASSDRCARPISLVSWNSCSRGRTFGCLLLLQAGYCSYGLIFFPVVCEHSLACGLSCPGWAPRKGIHRWCLDKRERKLEDRSYSRPFAALFLNVWCKTASVKIKVLLCLKRALSLPLEWTGPARWRTASLKL